MHELTKFLLARIDEDQQALRSFDARFGHDRWTAGCDVRRRIVDLVAPNLPANEAPHRDEVLRFMAMAYADHPQYRKSWRI